MSGNYPAGVTDADPHFDLPSVGEAEVEFVETAVDCPTCKGRGGYWANVQSVWSPVFTTEQYIDCPDCDLGEVIMALCTCCQKTEDECVNCWKGESQ
jgi:hypothetical protein